MITYDISLGALIVGVVGTLLTTLTIYLIKVTLKLVKLIERHEKVLFGDPDIEDWTGLVKISLANKKYSIIDRKAFIALMSNLSRNKIIDIHSDKDLLDAFEVLKNE